MSLNPKTESSFQAAALSIFDSMISSTGELYQEPLGNDPRTGVPQNPDATHSLRMYGATVTNLEGLDQEVQVGDRIFYMLVSELPVVPSTKGFITFEGTDYNVYAVQQDAAHAVWKCFARIP